MYMSDGNDETKGVTNSRAIKRGEKREWARIVLRERGERERERDISSLPLLSPFP
jgi:hypothetical protein